MLKERPGNGRKREGEIIGRKWIRKRAEKEDWWSSEGGGSGMWDGGKRSAAVLVNPFVA